MKKESFQGMLAIMGGLIGGVMLWGAMYRFLRLPGGCLMLWVITPILISLLCFCLSSYVYKFGALKSLVEKGVAGAKHLLNIEVTAFIALGIGAIAFIFKTQHLEGAGILTALSCASLSILCILAGIFACKVLKNK